jgi:tripartite ATP-independent transporter DctM subunit
MIVYGATVGTSVGAMFMAGIIPGIMIACMLMGTVAWRVRNMDLPKKTSKFTFRRLLVGFKDAALALIMPIIIIVGIRGGIFTPTEGGAVAVGYSMFVGIIIFRALSLKDVMRSAMDSAVTSAVIMMVVSASSPFGWIVAIGQGPVAFVEMCLELTTNPYVIITIVNVLLLIAGMFLEGAAIILLLAPVFAPLSVAIGMDPVHFAIIMVVNVSIGTITPPMGVNLFVAAPVAGVTMTQISRAILPFLAAEIVGLLLITFFPNISLWLPNLLR